MTSRPSRRARPPSRPAHAAAPGARRAASGFTLLEVLFAFAIFTIALSTLVGSEHQAVRNGGQALESRDTAMMADTVFRRMVYEIDKHNDGDVGTADIWYGEYIGLTGVERDHWHNYHLVLHKTRGMIAGVDPSGRMADLFQASATDLSGRSTGTTSGGTTSGSTSTATGTDTASGEEAYLLSMQVFVGEETETPVLTLRSVVPIPASEQDDGR